MQEVEYSMNLDHQRAVVQSVTMQESRPRIALIDSNDNFRRAMATCLRSEGFQVTELADIDYQAIVDVAVHDDVEAMLVDTDGMQISGEPLVSRLRRSGIDVPIAFISGKFNDRMEETALADGAVDFFLKHRGPTIVAKRTWLLINGTRTAGAKADEDEEIFRAGDLTLRLTCHRPLWREQQVPLTVTEFKIVRLLATHCGTTFSYREIYDQVHGPGFYAGDGPDGFRINVRALIKKIRKQFRSLDAGFEEIENIPGRGYRWRPRKITGEPGERAETGAKGAPKDTLAA